MNIYEKVLVGLDKNVLSLTTLDKSYTVGDLQDAVSRYELMLSPFNLEGKRVVLLVPSIKEFLSLFLAINKLKGTVIPLSLQFRREDLLNVIDFLDPQIVFTMNESAGFSFSEVVTNWAKEKNGETWVFTSDNCADWEVATFQGRSKKLETEFGGFICFTSGSTGSPKGMLFKDGVMDHLYKGILEPMELKSTDNVFVYASPSTQYAIAAMSSVLRVGATLVVSDEFDLVKMINTIHKANCNKLTTTPSIFKSLYNFASRLAPEVLKNLELVCVVGEKVPANFKSQFPLMENCTFLSHYGSSETGSLAISYFNVGATELIFTIANHVKFKTLDGELIVNTDGFLTEYYNNPILTQEAFENGWFKMGDLVEFIDDKTFKIVGRKKDVIKKGGQQVLPSEVEQILSKIEGVERVAVVGSPHEVYGEQVVAFIIAEGVTAKEIRSYCTGKISSFKIPDKVIFKDEFPLTNGKVDKIKLKSQLSRG